MLSLERLKELCRYDPASGYLIWIKSPPSSHAIIGDVVGRLHHGHLRVRIDGKDYQVSHLIWLYVTGSWPEHQIEHMNTINDDNRWTNLRLATTEKQRCVLTLERLREVL